MFGWKVKSVAEKMGVGFLGIGFQPKCEIEDIPIIPKVYLSFLLPTFQIVIVALLNSSLIIFFVFDAPSEKISLAIHLFGY